MKRLRAWWAKLPKQQRLLLAIGVPAVVAIAVAQNLISGRRQKEPPAETGTPIGGGQVVGGGLGDMTAQRDLYEALAGVQARQEKAASERRSLGDQIANLFDRLRDLVGVTPGGGPETGTGGDTGGQPPIVMPIPEEPPTGTGPKTRRNPRPTVPTWGGGGPAGGDVLTPVARARPRLDARVFPGVRVSVVTAQKEREQATLTRRVAVRTNISPVAKPPVGPTPEDIQVRVRAKRPRVVRSSAGSTHVVGVGVSSSARKRIV